MDVVQKHTGQITADTSPQERLTLAKALVADIRSHLSNGGHYDADTVAAIIKALLRVTLDGMHTNTEIRDYVISPEVCQVVQSLITGTVTASDVLRGMTAAVEDEMVGFDGWHTWSTVLARKWFVRPDQTVCPTSPGFVISLFAYHSRSGYFSYGLTDLSSDNAVAGENLLPLVRGALFTETAESINRPFGYGNSAFIYASISICQPQLTAALLSHEGVDVNAPNKAGETALVCLFRGNLYRNNEGLSIAQMLLAHPQLDVAVLAKDYNVFIDHLQGNRTGLTAARPLELLRLVIQHPTCTAAMVHQALEILVSWRVNIRQQDLYTVLVAELTEKISAKLLQGWTLVNIFASQVVPLPKVQEIMALPELDVSLLDTENKTSLDRCLDKLKMVTDIKARPLDLLRLISQHPTCTSAMIQKALETLVDWKIPSYNRLGWQNVYTVAVVELAGNTKYNVNTKLQSGKTLFHTVAFQKVFAPILKTILAVPGLDVSISDNDNKTVLDRCLDYLGHSLPAITNTQQLMNLITQHSSCTSAMIQRALERLVDSKVPSELHGHYTEMVAELAANSKYDINTTFKHGMTLAHMAASKGLCDILLKFMDIADFDPNTADEEGHTSLYYACEHLPRKEAVRVIDHPSVTWDFNHKNGVGQSVLDYYRLLPESKRDPFVMGTLEKKVGASAAVWEVRQSVQEFMPEMAFEFPAREIHLTPYEPGHAPGVNVLPSEREFVASKANLVNNDRIYRMEKAAKGRCCIISVPWFEVSWLIPLSGYNTDSQRLGELWSGLGFDVTMACCLGNRCLTAREIHNSVLEFSQSLTLADQCTVLCVLSHGGEGYIYGSDGNKARLDQLLRLLDNERCPAMAGKPKVVVVQACAGSRNDVGVMASHAPAVSAARTELDLPTMSDFIVCSPSLPGLASYVYDTPGRGSVFLERFVEVFSQHAKEDDINTMMTWVNREVAKSKTLVASPGASQASYRQMSNYHSCLTKLLYFFPCPGGQDWALV